MLRKWAVFSACFCMCLVETHFAHFYCRSHCGRLSVFTCSLCATRMLSGTTFSLLSSLCLSFHLLAVFHLSGLVRALFCIYVKWLRSAFLNVCLFCFNQWGRRPVFCFSWFMMESAIYLNQGHNMENSSLLFFIQRPWHGSLVSTFIQGSLMLSIIWIIVFEILVSLKG